MLTMVGTSVEDERVFSTVKRTKNELRNRLGSGESGAHLNVCIGLATQDRYTLESFPYKAAFNRWFTAKSRRGTLM